jgi:hypothetical protein
MPRNRSRYNYYALAQLGACLAGEGDAGGGGGGGDAAAQAAAAQAATDAAAKTAADEATAAEKTAAADAEATSVKGLPQWAQKIISDTRTEAATNRTKATEAATKATEAATAQQTTLDKLAIALGLKKDGGDAPDAAMLTTQVAAAQTSARESAVQLAVFKAASAAGANPNALLDRNSFTKAVLGLDPTKADFSTKVTAAITAAVTADPTLKAVPAAARSGVDLSGGTGEGANKPTTLASAVRDHYGA